MAANETVNWHPPHIKHGRFGDWLANNVDWALSRERYWGTPLPVWRGEDDPEELIVIGSLAELEQLSGVALEDPHRPYVDDVTFSSPASGQTMRRVPEVIDVWFDSGSMPFAQHHAPHDPAGQQRFEEHFPAQFICEALDQTRGWFYSLIAVSTLLFDRSSYENVVCLGLILDEDGKKMSKSRGNIVVPWDVIDELRRRRAALVLLHRQAAVGRLPLLAPTRSARACGCSSSSSGTPTRSSRSTASRTDAAATQTELDRWILLAPGGDGRGGHRAPGRLRRDVRRPRDRRLRRRPLQLVRAALAQALLRRRRGRVRDAARVPA